jgi:nicotinate-nucleotide--dimethylbenzimidazole phosphoribosyltransferase
MRPLEQTLVGIKPVDPTLVPAIQAHLDDLTKPPKSLGVLEQIAQRYCLATGTVRPTLGPKRIACFAGDHGVADEGVSAFPKAVTPQMVANMLAGGAAVNVLARHAGAELIVVDMGVDDPLEIAPGLSRHKVRRGTDNIARGPAMSVEEARQAVETGICLARDAHAQGIRMVGTGDMGIANTTPSAALFCEFLGLDPEDIVGRGTGLDDQGLRNKVRVVKQALDVNRDRFASPLETLAALGGFEIAGICGWILGAASCCLPVVVDGFISTAGALAALRMCPSC